MSLKIVKKKPTKKKALLAAEFNRGQLFVARNWLSRTAYIRLDVGREVG